jgi:hypothetical protein
VEAFGQGRRDGPADIEGVQKSRERERRRGELSRADRETPGRPCGGLPGARHEPSKPPPCGGGGSLMHINTRWHTSPRGALNFSPERLSA